jgi:hypothetical protein
MNEVASTYQSGLSVMVQYFSLTTKQHQPAYQSQKPSVKTARKFEKGKKRIERNVSLAL